MNAEIKDLILIVVGGGGIVTGIVAIVLEIMRRRNNAAAAKKTDREADVQHETARQVRIAATNAESQANFDSLITQNGLIKELLASAKESANDVVALHESLNKAKMNLSDAQITIAGKDAVIASEREEKRELYKSLSEMRHKQDELEIKQRQSDLREAECQQRVSLLEARIKVLEENQGS